MEHQELLDLYDRDERRETEEPGMRREISPGVVHLVDLVGTESAVVYSHLTPEDADAAISREAAYFGGINHNFEWKLYDHDKPQDLGERLLAHGFAAEEPDAIMVLDLASAPDTLLGTVPPFIRRVTDRTSLKDVTRVREAVWPEAHEWLEERLAFLLETYPDRVSIYVADLDGQPVSSARIQFSEKGTFASLWGGGTMDDYRGRGIYTALLSVRVQEARRRGARFLTIDASPMSRPIVEKHGFRLLTFAQAYIRRIQGDSAAPNQR